MIKDGDKGPTTFDYDGSLLMENKPGNRITSYSYDFANRLVRVDLPQDKFVTYGYDGDGNRIAKMASKSPAKDDNPGKGNGKDKDKSNNGKGPEENRKAEKQNISGKVRILSNDGCGGGNGGDNGGGNGGGNGGDNVGGNGNDNGGGNDRGNGNNSDGSNGNGNEKGNDGSKDNNGKGNDGKSNHSSEKERKEKSAEKEKKLNGKGYKGKGKYTNKGKHLGWYKNGKYGLEQLNPELIESTYYVNDPTGLPQVLMTYDGQDKYKAAYACGLERFEVQAVDDTKPESQDPLYYLYDGLGSVAQLTRPNGEVRDHYRYDEYGVPAPGAKLSEDGRNVNHNTFGYTGELWDEEDDLLYLRSRYYMPETGRFATRDAYPGSVINPLSMHKYAYVENSPVNFVDPLGFCKKDTSLGGGNDVWEISALVTIASVPGSYIEAGPDAIQKAGWGEARKLINSVLATYDPYGIPEPYSIGDYSYGTLFTDLYNQANDLYKNKTAWQKLVENSLNAAIAYATGRTGTGIWWADTLSSVTSYESTPSLSLAIVDSTSVQEAKATMVS